MDTEELLVSWSARAAMVLYVLALTSRMLAWRWPLSRAYWTAGCAMYLVHVGCAFQFVHHWSHDAAFAATARQTATVVGLDWGGGLYVNYLFTVVWLGDVAWWWLNPDHYLGRSPVLECAVQGFMGFIAFNATVIFASGMSRWVGISGCVLLATLWIRRRQVAAR